MALDPRKQECFGRYGYGNGYFLPEGQINARLASRAGRPPPGAFCNTCPRKTDCWAELRRRVDEADPIGTAAFVAAMDQEKAGGGSGGALAARMAASGNPDPWMRQMLANLQRGAEERFAGDTRRGGAS